LIRSEDGSHGIFELSFGLPSSVGKGALFRITGTDGTLKLDNIEKKDEETGKNKSHYRVQITNNKTEQVEEITEVGCGVEKELESFAACIKGTDDGLGSPRGALQDVAIIEAALNSQGSVVDLQKLVSP
jgi:predicted dehydrogenase